MLGEITLSLLPKHDSSKQDEKQDRKCIKSCDYKICSIRNIQIDDLKNELTSSINIENTNFKLTYNSRIKNNITRNIRIKVLGDDTDQIKAL